MSLLPWGGLPRGALIECLEDEAGAGGAGILALILARQAAVEGGAVVILDPQRSFYPPAAAVLGIDLDQLLVIRASRHGTSCGRWTNACGVRRWRRSGLRWSNLRRAIFGVCSSRPNVVAGWDCWCVSSAARKQPSWSELQLWIHPQACGAEDRAVRDGGCVWNSRVAGRPAVVERSSWKLMKLPARCRL